MNVQKTINSIKSCVAQKNKAYAFIATELARPTAPDNRVIAVTYYAVQCGLTIEWAIKSRRAYKTEGWKGVGKQYLLSSAKSLLVDHYVLRATVELLEINTKVAKAAKSVEAAKEDTNIPSLYKFNTEMEKVIKNAMAGLEVSLQSSL